MTAPDVGPEGLDVKAIQTLMTRLRLQCESGGDVLECHATVTELGRHLRLLRIIVPQHNLWTVNPYERCDFRCTYCSVYAQGAAVPVLTGDALRRRLRLELSVLPPGQHTALSSMCDAYVPAEAHLGISRIVIEELIAAGCCVHVATKGTTVLRDVDLLRIARCGKVEVSLCTLDRELAAVLEPGAPPPDERLSLVDALAAAGIDVGIMIAPWIPDVTDVAAFAAAAGPGRRITISPLKCNASGAKLKLAGRTYAQQTVNIRYREERKRFRGWHSLKWEAPWQLGEHYSSRYLPLSFEESAGVIRSPEPTEQWRRRLLRLVASSRLWRCASRVHAAVYRLSGGRVGHRIGRRRHLLLTTRGRRSGRPHTVALAYFEDAPRWVVIAVNAGADRDPVWLLNLRADPSATVRVGRLQILMTARPASGPERLQFLMRAKAESRVYASYERMTARQLAVIVLQRRKLKGLDGDEKRCGMGGCGGPAESGL